MAATPDELDILVTSKNHDLKSSVASRAAPGDWLFAPGDAADYGGFGGAGNYGVSRMNGGFGSRPAFTLAPVEGLGAHLRMDIVTLLDQMGSLAREFPMRPGGIGLVWTVPWDGSRGWRSSCWSGCILFISRCADASGCVLVPRGTWRRSARAPRLPASRPGI